MANYRQHNSKDNCSDAMTYAAGTSGATAAEAAFNARAAGEIFQQASTVITENQAGGGGYYAEAFHTATFNLNAHHSGSNEEANRLGSTDFASTDVSLSSGEQFQCKYYETSGDTYRASAEMLDSGEAKYANTTVVVPADQLADIQSLHQQAIAEAYVEGDIVRAHELESIHFADHIVAPDGTESTPLDYADARLGAENMRNGILPDWVCGELNLGVEVAEGALMAVGMSMAVNFGGDFLSVAADVVGGKMSLEDARQKIMGTIRDPAARKVLGQGAMRGGGAAAVTALDILDPLGASLVTNVLVDTIGLAQKINQGEIAPSEFGSRLLTSVKDRSLYSGITGASVWAMGPVGLLVPIVIRHMVRDQKFQHQALEYWHDISEMMQKEMRERAKTAATMDETNSHYRCAEANAENNLARSKYLQERFNRIAGLLCWSVDNKGHKGAPA